jgi:restriction endonuclease fold toxin 7 of polymorphic toxin system
VPDERVPPACVSDDSLHTVVRAELSQLDVAFADALAGAAARGVSAAEVVQRALARIRQRDAPRLGRLGERVARARPKKRRIPSLSGSARFRVPDILTDVELIEVKNVRRLALTPQLRDFADYATAEGITFVLVTRFDTVLAPELAALVAGGRIEHRELSGLLSANGRHLIRRLINDELAARRTGYE